MNAPSTIDIFDQKLRKIRLKKIIPNFENYDFLFRWTENQILDRLSIVTKKFDNVLIIGTRVSNEFLKTIKQQTSAKTITHYTEYDDLNTHEENNALEHIPFEERSFDLIINNLNFHTINDLPGYLLQLKNCLKPDGLLVGSMFGGETLSALRSCLMEAELEVKGGMSPRVFPFADKQDMGALLQRAGYNLPVIDSDFVTVTYEHMFKLMHDLRGMGESNIIKERSKTFTPRNLFFKAAEMYQQNHAEDDGRIPARFEIIFLHGWSPHSSQQQPLKPGSAQNRLADALNTDEHGTGEKPA